jgi:hypothetical protein
LYFPLVAGRAIYILSSYVKVSVLKVWFKNRLSVRYTSEEAILVYKTENDMPLFIIIIVLK